jgi:hypothetical protein
MIQIRQSTGYRQRWEVVDETDHTLLLMEVKNAPPECSVRRFRSSQNEGRGELITKFLGRNAFESACKWILTDENRPFVK